MSDDKPGWRPATAVRLEQLRDQLIVVGEQMVKRDKEKLDGLIQLANIAKAQRIVLDQKQPGDADPERDPKGS